MPRLSRRSLIPRFSRRTVLAVLTMLTLAGLYAPHAPAQEPEEPCLLDTHLDSFSTDATTITAGDATTLRWTVVVDNSGCRLAVQVRLVAGSGTGPLVSKQGSQSVAPTSTTTYRLKATYAGQTITLQPAVTITVLPGAPEPADPCENTCTHCVRPPAVQDHDADGIPDRLEHDLAHRFFPAIRLQWPDIDRDASYLAHGKALPYTVEPLSPKGPCDESYECLEIRYGIAYFTDDGDDDFGGGHLGDSEFYAVLVRRSVSWSTAQNDVSQWTMMRDFTAAHWGGAADSSVVGAYGFCYLYNGLTCYESTPRTSHTTLYAAEGKHALYHTDGECDNGGAPFLTTDECPTNQYIMRDMLTPTLLQNVGNSAVHGSLDTTIQHPVCGDYDVWSGAPFGDPEVTSYRHHFLALIPWGLETGGGGGINNPGRRVYLK